MSMLPRVAVAVSASLPRRIGNQLPIAAPTSAVASPAKTTIATTRTHQRRRGLRASKWLGSGDGDSDTDGAGSEGTVSVCGWEWLWSGECLVCIDGEPSRIHLQFF